MNYDEALEYVLSLTNLENTRRFDLMKEGFINVSKILEAIKIDYNSKKIIHVAGTKGKGTVSYFSSYLISKFSNLRVGLFTSPHLVSINERISIVQNGDLKNISNEEFAKAAEIIKRIKEKNNIPLTTFDFLTSMAMYYFLEKNIDVIVLEVGLGGRLDSTNFCIPSVSVITLVDYDHTNVLGKTLSRIAYEKAGIIKEGIPVISSKQKKIVKSVIKSISTLNNANVTFVDEVYKIDNIKISIEGTKASVKEINNGESFKISINLIGKQFIENLLVSYLAVNSIIKLSKSVLENLVFNFKGRFEIINRNPLIVFDVAHTPKSIDTSIKNYLKLVKYMKFNLIISLIEDKDIERISKVILKYEKHFDNVIILRLEEHDGSKALAKNLKSLRDRLSIVENIKKPECNTLIVGSFRTYKYFYDT
ncbi:MAG: bifunctional folylpolyglutamate synthase/dihydrofolate synthase [Brevinematia bacterium]